ncbi:MAG: DUF4398 domain-containing protein [Usitatibacter sp.]
MNPLPALPGMTAAPAATPRAAALASILGAALTFGCASYPVPELQLAASQAAVGNAAVHAAPSGLHDLALAREKMGLARHLASSALPQEARWLAEQAEVDAQLAQAKVLAANAVAEAVRWQRLASARSARLVQASAARNPGEAP